MRKWWIGAAVSCQLACATAKPAQEMVRRFWLGTVLGSHVGHGETYLDAKDVLWWSKGGVLHGESPKRIAFLKHLIEQFPPEGIDPLPNVKYPNC